MDSKAVISSKGTGIFTSSLHEAHKINATHHWIRHINDHECRIYKDLVGVSHGLHGDICSESLSKTTKKLSQKSL